MRSRWCVVPKTGWYMLLDAKTRDAWWVNVLSVKTKYVESWDRTPGITGMGSTKVTVKMWKPFREDTETLEFWGDEGQLHWFPVDPPPDEHTYSEEEDEEE